MSRRFSPQSLLLLSSVVGYTAYGTVQHTVATTVELKVITSGGFAAAFDLLTPKFEQQSGVIIDTSYGSSSGGALDPIPVRLANDETFDPIILPRSAMPDISTPAAFIDSLLTAKSIGYSASVSDTYLGTKLWPQLGIWR